MISGDETKGQFKKSIRNAFEIKYRETFPTHTLMHLTRDNAWQLILGEVQCDCILFCEDLEDVIRGFTLDDQADFDRVLRQYVYDDKRILLFCRHSPQEMEGLAVPLCALLSHALPTELKP